MKKLLSLMVAGVLAMSAAVSDAQPPAPMPEPMHEHAAAASAGGLYHCVKVKDPDHIACCAKPIVVEIVDPCWKPDPCNPCCKAPCVKVQICVPDQCCPPKETCSKDGKHKKWDFGKYAVEVRSKKGYVEVDYDN